MRDSTEVDRRHRTVRVSVDGASSFGAIQIAKPMCAILKEK
jgi:hypothetical protein